MYLGKQDIIMNCINQQKRITVLILHQEGFYSIHNKPFIHVSPIHGILPEFYLGQSIIKAIPVKWQFGTHDATMKYFSYQNDIELR